MRRHTKFSFGISALVSLSLAATAVLAAACAGDMRRAPEAERGSLARSGTGAPPSGGPPSGGPPSGGPGGRSASGPQGRNGSPPGGNGSGMGSVAELAAKTASAHFSDCGAATAAENAYIDYLYDKGILVGYDKLYYPTLPLARRDLAAMLHAKYAYTGEGFGYGDVPTDAYYFDAVMRGKACKVFEDAKYFAPDESVTREQAALWMYASEVWNHMPAEFASDDVSAYRDAAAISPAARKAVGTMTRLGVLKADASGNFNPKGTFTRAEAAPIMYRLLSVGGAPGGNPPTGGQNGKPTLGNTMSGAGPGKNGAPGGSTAVDHGSYAALAEADVSGVTYSSSGDRQNALRVAAGKKVTLKNITLAKTGGEPGSGESSNFYGSNAAFLALDGAVATIDGIRVTTVARGANGLFAYGAGTKVSVRDAEIKTAQDSSGGVMVAGGGTIYLADSRIETSGESSAPLRSDRGGGTLDVTGGTYVSSGMGSPAIYSTAAVSARGATLTATGSEAVVIEGKNSVRLTDCVVSGSMVKPNAENLQTVMIYQSMSGDATAGKGEFAMTGGSLTSLRGDLFYVTNTVASIELSGVTINPSAGYLLRVAGNDARNGWGVVGKNGGSCALTATGQALAGVILVDRISSLRLSLRSGSSFAGAINPGQAGGQVTVDIDASSVWSLTGDSHVDTLVNNGTVTTGAYKLYVGGSLWTAS